MIEKLSIRPKTTAVLLMDFQRMVVDSYAADKEALLGRVKRLAVPGDVVVTKQRVSAFTGTNLDIHWWRFIFPRNSKGADTSRSSALLRD